MKTRMWWGTAVFFLSVSLAAAGTDVNVYDDVVYLYLDKFYAAGLIAAYMPQQKPLARNAVASLVVEARKNAALASPALLEMIQELEKEFADAIQEKRFYWRPLDSFSMSLTATNQPESAVPDNGLDSAAGRVQPLLSYSNGDSFGRYASGYFYTVHTIRAAPFFAAYMQPKFYAREDDADRGGIGLYRGYMKTGFRNLEIQAGRDSLQWGPGDQGIFFSSNARPLDMIKISSPKPFRLPWLFKYAGTLRGTAFVSWLGERYHPAGATLSGYRLDYSPWSWVNIGFDHAVFMGGEGADHADFGQILQYFTGFLCNSGKDKATTNHLIGVDAAIKVPQFMGMSLYGKMLFEDTQAERMYMMKSDILYQGGVYFPRMNGLDRLSFRLEGHYSGQYVFKHGFYTDGFALDGKFIGYDAGPDTYSGLLTLNYQFGYADSVGVTFRYLRRSGDHYYRIDDPAGKNIQIAKDRDRPEESHHIFKLNVRKKLFSYADLHMEAGYDRKYNVDFINGAQGNDFSLQARIVFHLLPMLRVPDSYSRR